MEPDCHISGFLRVDEKSVLLRYYAASGGNFLPTFRETYRSHPQGSRPPPPQKKNKKQKSTVLSYFVAEVLKPRTLRT